jgi:hypothetical protein
MSPTPASSSSLALKWNSKRSRHSGPDSSVPTAQLERPEASESPIKSADTKEEALKMWTDEMIQHMRDTGCNLNQFLFSIFDSSQKTS